MGTTKDLSLATACEDLQGLVELLRIGIWHPDQVSLIAVGTKALGLSDDHIGE